MLSACLAATAFARPTFNVRDYGAVGDNATDDTGAFEKAIAHPHHDQGSMSALLWGNSDRLRCT